MDDRERMDKKGYLRVTAGVVLLRQQNLRCPRNRLRPVMWQQRQSCQIGSFREADSIEFVRMVPGLHDFIDHCCRFPALNIIQLQCYQALAA